MKKFDELTADQKTKIDLMVICIKQAKKLNDENKILIKHYNKELKKLEKSVWKNDKILIDKHINFQKWCEENNIDPRIAICQV